MLSITSLTRCLQVLDQAPAKDKVETAAKPDVGTGNANTEALSLLGQQPSGAARFSEPTSGMLDFGHGGDIFQTGGKNQPGDASQGPTGVIVNMDDLRQMTNISVPKDESVADFAKGILGKDTNPNDLTKVVSEISQANHIDINAMLHTGQDVLAPILHGAPGATGPDRGLPPGDVRPPAPSHPGDTHPGAHKPGDVQPQTPAQPGDVQPHAHAKPGDGKQESYTVKPGDSLWKIERHLLGPHASNADVLKGVHELAKANHIPLHTDSHGRVSAMIRPGEHLKVPAAHGHGDQPPPQPHRPQPHPEVPPPAPHGPQPHPDVPPPAPDKPAPGPDKPAPAPDKPAPGPDKPVPAPDAPPGHGGDKPLDPKEKPGPAKPENSDSPEKQKLVHDAEDKFRNQPGKLAEFKANMKALEDRAGKDHLSPQEVQKTYKEVDRLLEAEGNQPLKPEQRKHLAEQVMKQAGHPQLIDQGQHNTCAVANGVESRMYTRNPSDAAKLVTDVATTGQYTTKEGRTIQIDAKPHGESTWNPTPDGSRTHASEIFQLTAVNIKVDKENQSTNPPGQMRYEHRDPVPGSGNKDEVMVDYSKNPKGDVVDDSPGFTTANDGSLRDIYQSITGIHETGTVVGSDSYLTDRSDAVKRVHTEQEFNDYLAQCKKDGKFPVAIALDTTSEPFWTDSGNGAAGGSGGGHILTVTDYTPGNPPKVDVDNSWGSRVDHQGANALSVHDLYQAMDAPANKARDMKQDVDYNRAHGNPNHYKEFELERLNRLQMPNDKDNPAQKQANDQKYEQSVMEAMRRAQQDWAQHPNPAEQAQAMEKLNNIIKSMPPDAAKRLQDEEKRLGLS
jgi:hypothetical protein